MKDILIGAIVLLIAAIYFLHGTAMYIAIGLIIFGVVSNFYYQKHPAKEESETEIEEDEMDYADDFEDEYENDEISNKINDNHIDTSNHKIEDKNASYKSSSNKKKKKNWDKLITIIILVFILIFGLSKCTNSNKDNIKETKQSEKTSETKKKKKKKEKTFKEFENTTLKDSFQALKDTGYTITYRYKSSDYDCTQEYANLSNDSEFLDGWIITSIENVDNDKKSFTVYIQTQDSIDAETQRSANAKALTSKLEEVAAWKAVQEYGLTQYSDFKVHYLTGKLANEPKDENTWFLKASVTYKNELGNKIKSTCEAEVTGTTNNPQVTYFLVN